MFIVSLLAPSVASAQSKWTLTTADFRTAQVELSSLDSSGAKVTADGSARTVKWDELLLLDREATAKAPTTAPAAGGKFVLYLAGGDQFRGEPQKLENEALGWTSRLVGATSVPLKQVVGIVRANQPPPQADAKRTEDVVTLTNGDSVRGILSGLEGGVLKMQSQGNDVPVPLDSVSSVLLAAVGEGPATPAGTGRAFRVRLADESVVTASALRATEGGKFVMQLASGERTIPLDAVAGIEQVNGPVSWLSSRTPTENVQTPLLDTARPARMDRTVTGKPIRFGERSYGRGIGVAPYSRLTWALPPGAAYKAFRTQYAIDGNGPYADVAVRIKLDGKTVHERNEFTAGVLSPVVLVPLGGAKTLTLEVDFGGNYNVQDRFNWIEPALVTSAAIPAAPPALPKARPATTTSPASTAPAAPSAPSAQ